MEDAVKCVIGRNAILVLIIEAEIGLRHLQKIGMDSLAKSVREALAEAKNVAMVYSPHRDETGNE